MEFLHYRGFKSMFLSVALLVAGNASAQNYNLLWDKTYGGSSRDWNCTTTIDAAGSLYLTGDSQTDVDGDKTVPVCAGQSGNADIWIVKLDTAGSILWQRDLGGDGDERFPQLVHLNNPAKEMLLACFSTSDTACDKTEPNRDTVPLLSADYWICLLDSTGNKIWDKTLGGDNYDDHVLAAVFPSGDILLSGESNSPVGYDKSVPNYSISNDFWTLLLDPSGNILWDKVYGGDGSESLGAVIADDDGTFLLAGTTNSDVSGDVSQAGQGLNDFWVIKLDATGNKIWDKRFGGSGPDICNSAARTPDNGYILFGFTVSPQDGDVSEAPKGFQDYWMVKIDSAGNKIWDKRFGGTDGSFGTWVSPAQGGGYWLGGYSDSDDVLDVSEPPYGGSDYWFIKTDQNGNKVWDKRLGGSGDDYFLGLSIASDSALYAYGYADTGSSAVKTAPAKGWLDYWLVKFSYTDTLTSVTDDPVTLFSAAVAPNPSDGIIEVILNATSESKTEVSVSDLAGRKVFHQLIQLSAGYNSLDLDLQYLNPGGYMFTVQPSNGRVINKKIILY